MTKISLVRHGLVDNPAGVYYGRLPGFALAEAGRTQAAAAGDYLASTAVDLIYHSPLLRAYQTAAIVRAHCAITSPLEESQLLNEIFSPYDGHPIEEMERRNWDFYHETAPSFEKPEDIAIRMVNFFDLARKGHPGSHIVGVTHADPIAFAILWAHGLDLSAEQRKRLEACGVPDRYPTPASVSTFTFADGKERKLVDFRYHAPAAYR